MLQMKVKADRVKRGARIVYGFIQSWVNNRRCLGREIRRRSLSNASLLGSLGHEELVSQYNRSKIFVLPTYYEGLPTTVMEAMACVPVVASNVSEIPDLVEDGINGYIVPLGDAAGFADRLVELLENPKEQRKLGKAEMRKIERQYTSAIASEIITLYRKVQAISR